MQFGNLLWRWSCLFGLLFGNIGLAQFNFEIVQLPEGTPSGAHLFLTGSFNDWAPGDPAFQFNISSDGSYLLQVDSLPLPSEYKITRGSWATVEGDSMGNANSNRILNEVPESAVPIHIDSWEDMPPRVPKGFVKILVEQIPDNTPPDAPIYIVGNFNSWHPGDPQFRLTKTHKGQYITRIPVFTDEIQFKFTRGNWETVEGRSSGRARTNRTYRFRPNDRNTALITIETWEDLSGGPFNAFTIVWLLAALLGLLLVIAINTLHNNNVSANRILSVLILLISVTLLSRVVVYDRDIFQRFPKLLLAQDFMLFLYAPVFLVYIRRLLFAERPGRTPRFWLHFLPFGLHIVAYLPLFFREHYTFISNVVDLSLQPWFFLVGGIGLVYNILYWFHIRRLIVRYQKNARDHYTFEQNLAFLNAVMYLKAICLFLWAAAYFLGSIDSLLQAELITVAYRMVDILFLFFSLTVFCLSFFAIREPEIFKLPEEIEEEQPVEPVVAKGLEAVTGQDWKGEKGSLIQLMSEQRPYLNPKLTLSQLAENSGHSGHHLSRLINEGFGVNFNDFINSYRIEAFKQAARDEKYQNHTILAIALMVGFNSKTAFNRSFKKLSGNTPREWMQENVPVPPQTSSSGSSPSR